MKHKSVEYRLRLSPEEKAFFDHAAQTIGLSVADLFRVGAKRLVVQLSSELGAHVPTPIA